MNFSQSLIRATFAFAGGTLSLLCCHSALAQSQTVNVLLEDNPPFISSELQNYLPSVRGSDSRIGFNGADIGEGVGTGVDEIVAFSFLFSPFNSISSAFLTLDLTGFGTETDELLFADNFSVRGAGSSEFYGNQVLAAAPFGTRTSIVFDLFNIDSVSGNQNLSSLLLDGDLNIVYADDAIIHSARLDIRGIPVENPVSIPEPGSVLSFLAVVAVGGALKRKQEA